MANQQLEHVIERTASTTSGFTMLFVGIAVQAVVAARRLIVEAAVGMVDHALRELSDQGIVQLDEERKAAMVNNLMVVLTSEQSSAPVLNTGTLYG